MRDRPTFCPPRPSQQALVIYQPNLAAPFHAAGTRNDSADTHPFLTHGPNAPPSPRGLLRLPTARGAPRGAAAGRRTSGTTSQRRSGHTPPAAGRRYAGATPAAGFAPPSPPAASLRTANPRRAYLQLLSLTRPHAHAPTLTIAPPSPQWPTIRRRPWLAPSQDPPLALLSPSAPPLEPPPSPP